MEDSYQELLMELELLVFVFLGDLLMSALGGKIANHEKIDHLSFIKNLSFSNQETIILGDFNLNIPKKNQPEIVFSSFKI